ncbi:hypothetical protein PIB30_037186, partial [Stylosanthes scabra]|nr:hypothetical protein [Stylosanthes scabra]
AGVAVDIFISRKRRRKISLPFPFVRFDAKGGAVHVVEMLNGFFIGTRIIEVKYASFARRYEQSGQNSREGRLTKEGQPTKSQKSYRSERSPEKMVRVKEAEKPFNKGKVIEVEVVQAQVVLLKQSIIVQSVVPFNYIEFMMKVMDGWKGPGRGQGRDMGPYHCVLSFESIEVRDEALKNPFLLLVFLEMRPQWGYS